MPEPIPDRRGLQIETPRLLMRLPLMEDFDAWAEHVADEEAARFLGGPQPRGAAWRGFMTMAGSWHLMGFAMFSVIEKSTGRWVGRIGPWQPEGWPGTEVGWSIVRDRWRLGYATEAATAAIDWAFDELGWHDVIHVIDPDNIPSQAVARKLGSRNRGPGRLPAPHENAPVEIWGQTREEWRSRTSLV
jgi:RimJ/RimL family protein N-acetyltransferase